MTSNPILHLERVQALHPQTGAALHQPIDLSLFGGDIGILFGENGAGKSSLLDRIVYGQKQHRGQIHINRRAISFLPQISTADFQLPLRLDELAAWSATSPPSSPSLWNSASGGERQMALLDMVLAGSSPTPGELLVLDEPTNHLAPSTQAELEKRVLQWLGRSPQRAILIVSHNPELFLNHQKTTFEVVRA